MKSSPTCWKCNRVILEPIVQKNSAVFSMVGCSECDEIKKYEDAKNLCPLLKYKKYIFFVRISGAGEERREVRSLPPDYKRDEILRVVDGWANYDGERPARIWYRSGTEKNIERYINAWKREKERKRIRSCKRLDKSIIDRIIKNLEENPSMFEVVSNSHFK